MKKDSLKNNYFGIFTDGARAYLYSRSDIEGKTRLLVDSSADGFKFDKTQKEFLVTRDDGVIEKFENCNFFKIFILPNNKYGLFYKTGKPKPELYFASSTDVFHFLGAKKVQRLNESAMIVPNFKWQEKFVAYYGEKDIHLAYSSDLAHWDTVEGPVLPRRSDNFDSDNLLISDLGVTHEGIFVVFFSQKAINKKWYMGTALFETKDPQKLVFRANESLWEEEENFLKENVRPIGSLLFNSRLIVYFVTREGKLYAFSLKFFKQSPSFQKAFPPYILKKFVENPIIRPLVHHFWESRATFNPAAIYAGDKVHILYRAVGDSDSSVIGYAGSRDGTNIDERLDNPVYVPREPFECSDPSLATFQLAYSSGGGGNGGCEDPKLTEIEGRIYMTYVAFSGRSYPGVALTSIKKDDFLAKNFNWEKPVLISHPNEMHKNWLLFPEKINGKYAILHNISPKVSIEYIDELTQLDGARFIKSWDPHNFWGKNHVRHYWDSHVRGPGPPPLKTNLGWLLLYHAMDYRDYNRYKVGAMILDAHNPAQVLYRSRSPVMEPDRPYENDGYKSGVVYAGGAVIKDGELFIYYGGADKYACVAKADLEEFLTEVKRSEVPQVSSIKFGS